MAVSAGEESAATGIAQQLAVVDDQLAAADRRDREAAKREAAAVIAGPNAEFSAEEISRALVYMRARWQHTYGLVEVG